MAAWRYAELVDTRRLHGAVRLLPAQVAPSRPQPDVAAGALWFDSPPARGCRGAHAPGPAQRRRDFHLSHQEKVAHMNSASIRKILALGAITGMRSMAGAATLAFRHGGPLRRVMPLVAVAGKIADKKPANG